MSVLGTVYARAGLPVVLTPPRPGIYYVSMAVYNALTPAFTVQNGVDQSTLSGQTAQLFAVPSSGSPMQLAPEPEGSPYGTYLGPLDAVWYEPNDAPGAFPVTLGALAGLIQWTPLVTLDVADPIFVAPGTSCYAIALGANSDPSQIITVTGVQSGKIVGQSIAPGSSSTLVQLESGTGDTIFAITASSSITAILSLSVGPAPLVNAAQTTGMQQVLIKTGGPELSGAYLLVNTNPLWRAIFIAVQGTGPFVTPVVQGSTGFFYEATTPPYLVPIPHEQMLWRFHILTGVDTEVAISLPSDDYVLVYIGADFADVDVEAYNSGGGDIGTSNTPDPLRFSYAGDLDASLPIPGGYISCPPGSTVFLTRLWAEILAGTSVDVTVRVNSAPAYSGPVDVAGLTAITITPTPGGFVLPTPLEVFDLDYVDIVLGSLVGTPAGLAAMVDELLVP